MDELAQTLASIEEVNEEMAPAYLDEPYKPVGQLHIPETARQKFKELGYDLQWVRIYDQGKLDLANIQRKESDMYTFVPRDEIEGLTRSMTSYFQEELRTNDQGLYVVNECALAKVPFAQKERKRRYLKEQTRSRSSAVTEDLKGMGMTPQKEFGEEITVQREVPTSRTVSFGE